MSGHYICIQVIGDMLITHYGCAYSMRILWTIIIAFYERFNFQVAFDLQTKHVLLLLLLIIRWQINDSEIGSMYGWIIYFMHGMWITNDLCGSQ